MEQLLNQITALKEEIKAFNNGDAETFRIKYLLCFVCLILVNKFPFLSKIKKFQWRMKLVVYKNIPVTKSNCPIRSQTNFSFNKGYL